MMTVASANPMPLFILRPGEHRAEHIAQVERQHKVQRIAARHAAQHPPTHRPLINADELLPPQQAEGMAHQHQHQSQQ